MRSEGLAEIVFDVVSMIKAPGTRSEWDNIVKSVVNVVDVLFQ